MTTMTKKCSTSPSQHINSDNHNPKPGQKPAKTVQSTLDKALGIVETDLTDADTISHTALVQEENSDAHHQSKK